MLNNQTGEISLEYKVVFGESLSPVNNLPLNKSLDVQWSCIFKLDSESYLNLEYDQDGHLKTSHCTDLCSEWIDPISLSTTWVRALGEASDTDEAPGGAPPA